MALRNIEKKEIKALAEMFAEGFYDYPLYDAFFRPGQNRLLLLTIAFTVRLYTRRDYTYVTDNGGLVISLQRPGDRDRSALPLFLNPFFTLKLMFHGGLRSLAIARAYDEVVTPIYKKHFNPQTDTYVKMVCVKPEFRNTNLFFDTMKELDRGEKIFAETHSPVHVRLYCMIGAQVCEETSFRGIPHYALIRPPVQTKE